MKKFVLSLFVLLSVFLGMSGCVDDAPADGFLMMTVYRTDYSGAVRQVDGAQIFVDGRSALTRTDEKGCAELSYLPEKICEIRVEHPLYGSVIDYVDMRFNKQQEIKLHLCD